MYYLYYYLPNHQLLGITNATTNILCILLYTKPPTSKIKKLIFHSFQHISHLSCIYEQFLKFWKKYCPWIYLFGEKFYFTIYRQLHILTWNSAFIHIYIYMHVFCIYVFICMKKRIADISSNQRQISPTPLQFALINLIIGR